VAHSEIPRSVEAYYQEIGRAGRDGTDSLALLLFNYADVMMQRRMIDGNRASESAVRAVFAEAQRLQSGSLEDLLHGTRLSPQEVSPALRILESSGHLARGRGRFTNLDFELSRKGLEASALEVDFRQLEQRAARERQMLERMVRLADTRSCRRQDLLRYFGDPDAPTGCRACDTCVGARAPAPEEMDQRKPPRKTRSTVLERVADTLLSGEGARGEPPSPAPPEAPCDEETYTALKALRMRFAKTRRVPPYVVFHDSHLRDLSRALPESEQTFLLVKGMGPARWERYGAEVLELTRAAVARSPDARPPA
jgi:ATP-dependent DNA helicase RecQ